MTDAICVQSSADLLRDEVDVVILEVFGDSRHKSDTDSGSQQSGDTAHELRAGVLLVSSCVTVDNVPKDQRIKQREDLVDSRQKKCSKDKLPIISEISPERGHPLKITRKASELRNGAE